MSISLVDINVDKTLVHTPHLNGKKLLKNSPKDVLETMDDYWVGPNENFCPKSTHPGGAAIIFQKSGWYQNPTPL